MRQLRLNAEADAWPIWSPAAFHAGLIACEGPEDMDRLRQGFGERLARYGPSAFPYDPADASWGGGAGRRRLTRVLPWLGELVQSRLRVNGGMANLVRRSDEKPGIAELWWRFYSLRVAPEIILAACAAMGRLPVAPKGIDLLHPLVRSELPTAHLHIHLGAVGSSGQAWAALPGVLGSVRPLPGSPASGELLTMGLRTDQESGLARGRLSWGEAIRRALFAECVMSRFLAQSGGSDFERWATQHCDDTQRVALWELARGRLHADVREPKIAVSEDEQRLEDAIHASGRNAWSPADSTELLRAAWEMCQLTQDIWIERLLVQLLRVRCFVHQALVMDPSAPGLSEFRSLERRIRKLRPKATGAVWSEAQRSKLRVEAVELRFKPPDAITASMLELGENLPMERGWVIHLSRSFDGPKNRCPWPTQARRASHEAERLVERVRSAAAADSQQDRVLRLLRGLDLAGEEVEGPLWLFAPILRGLRSELDAQCASARVPGPGLTLHVGESFRHLATGLRAVHESLQFGLVRDGDRLGHALALGLDPARWAARYAQVHVRCWDRLLDLGWLRRVIASMNVEVSGNTLVRLKEEERALWSRLDDLAKSSVGWGDAAQLHEQLGELTRDEVIGLESGAMDERKLVMGLLRQICSERQIWAQATMLVSVTTELDVTLLTAVRDAICGEIAAHQLVIEVNPSSNLLVADLDHPLDQPMFHLRPVTLTDGRPLPVCLSADDPLTFATCFDDEVAYAWAGMVGAGKVPASYARAWIDDALRVGWRARFTLPPK